MSSRDVTSAQLLERLGRYHPKVIDLSLERVERLLNALGRPQDKLPPVIHIAGTNGKGSVTAMMRAMLEAAGLRVHVYTSPHLVRFHERIRVAGEIISEDALVQVLEDCERANDGQPITFFEITTAAAFLAFARTPADVCLLETGLGGRLDATNMVASPALTVITPISMDHEQYLGGDLASIAAEKAGILKAGIPCVVARQEPEAAAVIAARAEELGCPLWRQVDDFGAMAENDVMYWEGDEMLRLPIPSLPGPHQIDNAAVAVAAIRLMPLDVQVHHIGQGLTRIDWPGRLQRLEGQAPEGWEIWLDAGHNPGAAQVLVAQAESWRDRPLHVVAGMLNTRDPRPFVGPVGRQAASLRAITFHHPDSLPAAAIAQAARDEGLQAAEFATWRDALTDILAKEQPGRVLICGSVALVGEVLRDLER